MRGKSWISFVLGLLVAALFLFLTFRGMDLAALVPQWQSVGWGAILLLMAVNGVALFLRSYRWYMLLPQRRGDFWPATRALALSYGVSNVFSRLAEVVRVVVLGRNSQRSMAEVTATVMVDRLVFDLGVFACMFAVILLGFRDTVAAEFPSLAAAFPAFAAVMLVGFVGLVIAAWLPMNARRRLSGWFLGRWPAFLTKVDDLLDRLHRGLDVLSAPSRLLGASLANVAVWFVSWLYLAIALHLFGLELAIAELVLVFCVATVGLLVPSPGGVGTVHYFMSAALVHFAGTEPVRAAAAATFCHGVGFLSTTLFALVFWLLPNPRLAEVQAGTTGGSTEK